MLEQIDSINEKKKILIIFFIILAIILSICMIVTIIFSVKQKNDILMKKGVHIAGIDVSGLSKEKAKEKVEQKYKMNPDDLIYLRYKSYTYCISIEQINAEFDINSAIEKAYNIGRDGSILENDIKILKLMCKKTENVEMDLKYNDKKLTEALNSISTKLPEQVVQPSYYIEKRNLIITSGKVGIALNVDEMKDLIVKGLSTATYKNTSYSIITYNKYPNKIDVDAIHNDIYQEVKDAYYTTQPRMVYSEVQGIDFRKSVDEIKKEIETEKKDEYVVELAVTQPKVTTEDLGQEAFPNKLSTFSTNYYTSNKDRTTNLKLAAAKINGTVLMPGDTFSYNKVVGERTIAAGYKNAAIYVNGEVADGLGGGICQITTTLYDAVVYANLDIVQRQNHCFVPSYVTGGRDATVVYGQIDFKFKNNRDYPIKIKASVKGGIATVSIYGLKKADDYKIKITSKKVKNGGTYSIYKAYKQYYRNNKLVKTELLSTDTYKNH